MPIDDRRVTLKDIAEKTGFTVNTVSQALRGSPKLREETKAAIRAAAKELGYVHNALAGSLRSGSSRTIAIIVGDTSNLRCPVCPSGRIPVSASFRQMTSACSPASGARTFVPAPSRYGVTSSAAALRRSSCSSSGVLGKAISAAGPPVRNEVWRLSGSCVRRSRPAQVRAMFCS